MYMRNPEHTPGSPDEASEAQSFAQSYKSQIKFMDTPTIDIAFLSQSFRHDTNGELVETPFIIDIPAEPITTEPPQEQRTENLPAIITNSEDIFISERPSSRMFPSTTYVLPGSRSFESAGRTEPAATFGERRDYDIHSIIPPPIKKK